MIVVNDAGFFLSHRLPVAAAARAAGWEVMIAAPPGPSVEAVRGHGFAFHPIVLSRNGSQVLQEVRSVALLGDLIRRAKPDVVHLVTIKPVLYGGLVARLLGVRRIVSAVSGLGHVFIARGRRASVRRWAVKMAYRLVLRSPAQRVIFQNQEDLDSFVQEGLVHRTSTALIRGVGADLDAFRPHPEPEGPITIVLASRMLREKGVCEFVLAARRIRAGNPNTEFVLVGGVDSGNPTSLSESELHGLCADGEVRWMGHRNDMPQLFARTHIVCLPSYREGVPKVLIEAAAAGRPIVATDVPGCREVVEHEQNGLLVRPRSVDDLVEAFERLIADRPLRIAMGARGRRLAELAFSDKSLAEATLRLYDFDVP